MLSSDLVQRRLLNAVTESMEVQPAVAITGPQTSGKSTLASTIVRNRGGTFLDLDDPAVRALAVDDPTAFVRDVDEPMVIDEFQRRRSLHARTTSARRMVSRSTSCLRQTTDGLWPSR